jgi:hypothetical protein
MKSFRVHVRNHLIVYGTIEDFGVSARNYLVVYETIEGFGLSIPNHLIVYGTIGGFGVIVRNHLRVYGTIEDFEGMLRNYLTVHETFMKFRLMNAKLFEFYQTKKALCENYGTILVLLNLKSFGSKMRNHKSSVKNLFFYSIDLIYLISFCFLYLDIIT